MPPIVGTSHVAGVMRKKGKMTDVKLEIDGKIFEWGLTIDEVQQLFPNISFDIKINKYSNSVTAIGGLRKVLGLKSEYCKFHTNKSDRIIDRIESKLDLNSINIEEAIQSLNETFEISRSAIYRFDNESPYKSNNFWHLANFDAGIGIHNSCDTKKVIKVSLYFILRDIELIFRNYGHELMNQSKDLDKISEESQYEIHIFNSKISQMWSCKYEFGHYSAYEKPYVSSALNGYYKRRIFLTPSLISKKLRETEVCIYRLKESDKWFIANKHECVKLNSETKIRWLNTLPAKGPGNCTLYIGDIKIHDEHNQDETKKIIKLLEHITKKEITENKAYDC